MKVVIIGIIALVVIGGGGYLLLNNNDNTQKKTNTATTTSNTSAASKANKTAPSPSSTAQSAPAPTVNASGTSESFSITANDDSASPETVNVKQGDVVQLTFNVSSQGTYHGGLDFKSTDPAIDSGPIAEGTSKTTSFTATKSFKFTPYWYQSDVQKGYFVTINVQ